MTGMAIPLIFSRADTLGGDYRSVRSRLNAFVPELSLLSHLPSRASGTVCSLRVWRERRFLHHLIIHRSATWPKPAGASHRQSRASLSPDWLNVRAVPRTLHRRRAEFIVPSTILLRYCHHRRLEDNAPRPSSG